MPRGHVLPDCRSIANLRGEAGLTQHEVATRSGYGRRTISKIENGNPTTAPTLSAIATVLAQSLGRAVTMTDLVRVPEVAAAASNAGPRGIVVTERVLLLRLPSGTDCACDWAQVDVKKLPARAVLVDTTHLRFADAGLSEINFAYARFGRAVRGRSLSHGEAEWKTVRRASADGDRPSAERDRILRVPVSHFADRPLVVQNEIEYRGAFQESGEWHFDTRISYPTGSLTMLIHFPADRPFARLLGRCQRHASGPLGLVAEQPIALSPGRVAYWRIVGPAVGARYDLSWK